MLGLAVPVLSMVGCDDETDNSAAPPPGKVNAFKLSRNGQSACRACKLHARYKLFVSRDAADTHRAHRGCNCVIKQVRISTGDADRYFANSQVYDRRTAT